MQPVSGNNDIVILVVDDNPDHLELIVNALAPKCERHRIATAADGAQALDFLLARGRHADRDVRRPPRLVILDLRMGGVDGLAVLREMRADGHTMGVPVVVLSGSTEKRELDSCYEAGANSVIRKSPDFDEMQNKLSKAYDFWITVNESNRHSRV